MMVKAVMIGGNFMHLRYEKRNLAFMVAAGILVTSLILYRSSSGRESQRHVLRAPVALDADRRRRAVTDDAPSARSLGSSPR